jgi:hypothetical protein
MHARSADSVRQSQKFVSFFAMFPPCKHAVFPTHHSQMTAKNTFTTTRRFKVAFLVGEDVDKIQLIDYESNQGAFRICVTKVDNLYILWASPAPSYAQSYWVKSLDGLRLSSGKLGTERAGIDFSKLILTIKHVFLLMVVLDFCDPLNLDHVCHLTCQSK